ncbi:hypothetical protein C8F04DRAFT_1198981 [Mycena alexandri]|uniref:Uncharacterized protein n=1 Tax=Mycena alexandri TaxID=1745969 RepID=A0AAD6RZW0_9AGAR|nr:hypothetical protein C8F04DRAFT_1198981 [Mycena alexandri]
MVELTRIAELNMAQVEQRRQSDSELHAAEGMGIQRQNCVLWLSTVVWIINLPGACEEDCHWGRGQKMNSIPERERKVPAGMEGRIIGAEFALLPPSAYTVSLPLKHVGHIKENRVEE